MAILATLLPVIKTAGTAVGSFLSKNGGKILSTGAKSMGLFDGLFGGGNARKASETQYKYNLALQQQSQQWSEYMYRNRYQMQVEDLEKAGINKLYGLGSAPSVTSGTNSIGMPDMVGERNGRIQQVLTGIQLAQDWSAKKAQINLMNNQAKTEEQNTRLKMLEQIGKQLDNMYRKKELQWFDKQKIAELENLYSNTANNLAGAEYNRANAGTARKQIKLIDEEERNIREKTKGIERLNKWYKRHPILGGFAIGLNELNPLTGLGNTAIQQIGRAGTARRNR